MLLIAKQEVGNVVLCLVTLPACPIQKKNVCIVINFSSKRLVFLFMIDVLKAYLHVVC